MLNIGDVKVNSLDYILIVDRSFTVLFNTRYDPRVSEASTGYENSEYLGKNFFEIYPNMDRKSSSIVECITTGRVVIRKFQKYVDFKEKVFYTHNLTVPIIHGGHILGAVELVKDITTVDNVDRKGREGATSEFDELAFRVKGRTERISFDDVLTKNAYMLKNIEKAKLYATIKNPTLIYGETGTGKEVIAQAMIHHSGISRKKVVIQNCAAVPENLIESILFGTSRGAYTGAENKKGLFDEADGGILFLDELNAMPYHVQGKLLRVLQDGSFRPVGSNAEKTVCVKVIAAINVDPMEAIESKALRNDLFYRFSSCVIHLLPLRERKEDIAHYVDRYIEEFNAVYSKNVTGVSAAFQNFLNTYRWDGNVRELRHVIESMVGTSEGALLDVCHLPAYMYDRIHGTEYGGDAEERSLRLTNTATSEDVSLNLSENLQALEGNLIRKALKLSGGNRTKASGLLGIPRQTLKYRMSRLRIEMP